MTCADSCKLTKMKNEDLLHNRKDNYKERTLPCSIYTKHEYIILTRPAWPVSTFKLPQQLNWFLKAAFLSIIEKRNQYVAQVTFEVNN